MQQKLFQVNDRGRAKRSAVWAALLALFVVVPSVGWAQTQEVECFVYNDNYTDMVGPSDAFYYNGAGQICIPDSGNGTCRKWFGRCQTVGTGTVAAKTPVKFRVFDDDYTRRSGLLDSVYVSDTRQACLPDGTATGKCAKWFGRAQALGGFVVECRLFDDGYSNVTSTTDAIYFRGPRQVCMPDGTGTGTCRKWFGRCKMWPLTW